MKTIHVLIHTFETWPDRPHLELYEDKSDAVHRALTIVRERIDGHVDDDERKRAFSGTELTTDIVSLLGYYREEHIEVRPLEVQES